MAYVSRNSNNPFYSGEDEEENVDDFAFVNHPKQGRGYMLENERGEPLSDADRQRQMLMERKRELEESALRSTKSSLGMVYESEQMGMATAEVCIFSNSTLWEINQMGFTRVNSRAVYSGRKLHTIIIIMAKYFFRKNQLWPLPPASRLSSGR